MAAKSLFTLLFAIYVAVPSAAALEPRQKLRGHWVDIWATMPQLVEPHNMPNAPFVSILRKILRPWELSRSFHVKLQNSKLLTIRLPKTYRTKQM